MSKIAFDIDGVLVPDCDKFPGLGGLDEFYALTVFMRPLFHPRGEWYALTAREAQYRPTTLEWMRKHFINMPVQVWHEIDGQTPAEYKTEVINANGIELYIESDPDIVAHLKQHTRARIIHFDDFCGSWFK